MAHAFSSSKIPQPYRFKSTGEWIHPVGGFGGDEPSRKQLDGAD